MDKNIKDYREKELKSFAIGNILLILMVSGILDKIMIITDQSSAWVTINTIISSAVFSSLIYIFVFLADSLVPGNIKDKIIWNISGKPGEHIFTDIGEKLRDNRFTKEQANIQYENIYKAIKGKGKKSIEVRNIQNSAWYRVYKTHESHAQVSVSQRDYLLCRDMCVMTPLMMVGYLFLQWYRHLNVSCEMILLLAVECILLLLIARNKGRRFAYNVIAIDISKNMKEEKKSEIVIEK